MQPAALTVLRLASWLLLVRSVFGQSAFPANPPAGAEITSLPGFNATLPSRHFGGYINITGGSKHFYYYLATATANASSAPVVLWLNGGPGCSSMTGWATETGPFNLALQFAQPGNDTSPVSGVTLTQNQYAWNTAANMLFIDNPVGAGLSYSDNPDADYTTNDTITQADLYAAVQGFFTAWPEFQSHDFYVAGESYAGVYIPLLASAILNGNAAGQTPSINLKGYMLGNPATDAAQDDLDMVDLYRYWGLLPPSITSPLLACGTQNSDFGYGNTLSAANGQSCEDLNDNATDITQGVYTYNYQANCFWPMADFESQLYTSLQRQWQAQNVSYSEEYFGDEPGDSSCYSDDRTFVLYLNLRSVRNAIHAGQVPTGAGMFFSCTNRVQYSYSVTNVIPIHQANLNAGLRIIFFSGTLDSVVPWMGTYDAVQQLSTGRAAGLDWQAWSYPTPDYYGTQTAGFIQTWDNLSYVTFKNSGHEVPMDNPEQALLMFQAFLADNLSSLTAQSMYYPSPEFSVTLT